MSDAALRARVEAVAELLRKLYESHMLNGRLLGELDQLSGVARDRKIAHIGSEMAFELALKMVKQALNEPE